MNFEGMKMASHYQAFVKSPSYPILKQLAAEIREKYLKGLKVEKTSFKTAKNLIKYETAEDVFIEFFSTLEKRANGGK